MRQKREYRMVSKESFEVFKKKNPTIKINYDTWKSIIYRFNYSFRDHLLESAEKAKLPWGFGEFAVKKIKSKKVVNWNGKDVIKLPVDWKKSKEMGKKIYHFNYHTEGYRFAYKWFIGTARFKNSNLFVFKAYRTSSRKIKEYIEKGYDKKYLEWDSFHKKIK